MNHRSSTCFIFLADSYCKPLLQSFTGVTFNSIIHDEARQLRAQIPMTITVSKLLPLLERLLEMCSSIMTFIRGAVEIEARFRAIECFEFVWNISKIAFVRWEDLKGATDRNTWFNAVEFAYRILPVFLDLEKDEHLNMTEHIILLIINVVKNFQLPSLIRELHFYFKINLVLCSIYYLLVYYQLYKKNPINTKCFV